ncbi:peptidylprolyl isomerase [Anaeromyxobacter terrae]|uniref:peptidylprolyl isomerase n=1 Tax=Anaeromyxobacter terrae TaxID=2925406 RepID=UPI001F58B651|nr:peptidylprolyl isomerase [Anaeromyxobacter sp. SG22]
MTKPTVFLVALAACIAAPAARAETPAAGAKARAQYAVFETSRGKIGVRLLPGKAPKAVANFVELAEGKKTWTDPATGRRVTQPLYDGTLFHRVIPGFMIQGGDPLSRGAALGETQSRNGRPFGSGDPGYRFADELEKPPAKPFAKGCQLAMANSGPNTNGSQFFITEGATPWLDPKACNAPGGVCGYVHFGEGVCGCDLVAPIAQAGNGQTKLVKVTITDKAPTCK